MRLGHGGIAVSEGSRGFLAVGCFFHDPRSGLAGVLVFALVFSELDPETLLRVGDPLHGGHGNLELPIAKSADSDSGDRAHPFDHSKIAFRHEHKFPTGAKPLPALWISNCAAAGRCSSFSKLTLPDGIQPPIDTSPQPRYEERRF
jgi:hypothetical protein